MKTCVAQLSLIAVLLVPSVLASKTPDRTVLWSGLAKITHKRTYTIEA
jgi:hypothetical protein